MDRRDPELARLMERVKHSREHREPVEIRGGGTKRFYGGAPAGERLDMAGLTGISSYEPT